MREGFEKEGRHRKQEYEDLEKKVMMEIEDGFKNEENARQRVQKELVVMKDEIKNLRMGSGSTVWSEASTGVGLGSGTFARPPPLTSRWNEILFRERWSSKVGSLITLKVVFKGSLTMKVLMLVSDLEKMVLRQAHKWNDWDQTRKEQETWPTKTMVSMGFKNETNWVTMI